MNPKKIIILAFIIFFAFDFNIIFAQSDTTSKLPDLIPYRKGDKWGFCDREKNIVIPVQFDSVRAFYKDRALVKADGKYGLIDKNGNFVIPVIYNEIGNGIMSLRNLYLKNIDKLLLNIQSFLSEFREDLVGVRMNGKWGFLDLNGKTVIPLHYQQIGDFENGYVTVMADDKWGMIDTKNNIILHCEYDYVAYDFSNGLIRVKKNKNYGFYNKNGKEVIPLIYKNANDFSEGLAAVTKDNGKTGFIDTLNNIFIPLEYENAYSFNNGVAPVKQNGKYGLINRKEKLILGFKYDVISPFQNHCAIFSIDKKEGLLNTEGKVILAPEYTSIFNLFGELYCLKKENQFGFADTTGKIVVQPKELWASNILKGMILVTDKEKKSGYKDYNWNDIIPVIYDAINIPMEGLCGVKLNNKWGFVDMKNNEVIAFKYDKIYSGFMNGIALVIKDCKLGYIDKFGTEYWEE